MSGTGHPFGARARMKAREHETKRSHKPVTSVFGGEELPVGAPITLEAYLRQNPPHESEVLMARRTNL
jgi:hypothetical protein